MNMNTPSDPPAPTPATENPIPRTQDTEPASPPILAAIDPSPIAGPQITLRIGLTPGLITLLAAPMTVLLTMLLGWVVLKTAAMPLYAPEMFAAALINALAGMAASLPLLMWMKRGAVALAQAGMIAIGIRMCVVLIALLVACAPAWQFDRMPLIVWVIAFYFPLLIVESALVAWLINRAKH